MMALPTTKRVQDKLLRYHSACGKEDDKGTCVNTYGSYTCACPGSYLLTAANTTCVQSGGMGSYVPPFGKPQACPPEAVSFPGAKSADECFCPPGYEFKNASQECVQCEAGFWSLMKGTCQACWNNSWSLPGTINISNCLCNMGYYYDPVSNYTDTGGQCVTRLRGTPNNPCVQCPPFSNTSSAGSKSIWECKCIDGYVRTIDPGDPAWFVCAPEDACREEDANPCPKEGRSVCQSNASRTEFECQCNPAEGYEDRSLAGGFCLKMWYYNFKVPCFEGAWLCVRSTYF
jgi:hypothetical protein